jgi:8-oxo-dGTP diphosphatase
MTGEETGEKREYPRPSLTADVVVVALGDHGGLRVLFVERAHDPFAGAWALPGGFVEPTETVSEAAARELAEETSLTDVRIEELGCFSKPGRDPRGWVVTVAHLALVPVDRLADVKAGDVAASAAWLDLTVHPGGGFDLAHRGEPATALAFDHAEIITRAVDQLRDRVGELAFDLLPQPFKLGAARLAFEAILGEPVDPLTFERVLRDGMVRAVTLPVRQGGGIDTRYVSTRHQRSPWLRGREV